MTCFLMFWICLYLTHNNTTVRWNCRPLQIAGANLGVLLMLVFDVWTDKSFSTSTTIGGGLSLLCNTLSISWRAAELLLLFKSMECIGSVTGLGLGHDGLLPSSKKQITVRYIQSSKEHYNIQLQLTAGIFG